MEVKSDREYKGISEYRNFQPSQRQPEAVLGELVMGINVGEWLETFGDEPCGELNSARKANSKMHWLFQMKYKTSVNKTQSKLLMFLTDLYDYLTSSQNHFGLNH